MRDSLIAIAVAALVGICGWTSRGTPDIPAPEPAPSPVRRGVAATPAPVPVLQVASVAVPHVANSRRNLFAYVTAPPVPPAHSPRIVAAPPPPVAVAPPPAPTAPAAPQFSYRYIGRFGPAHKSIAVFTRDGELITAQTGTIIDSKFVLRAIHNDAVEVEANAGGEVHAIRVAMGR